MTQEKLGGGDILSNFVDKNGTNSGNDLKLTKIPISAVREHLRKEGIEVE